MGVTNERRREREDAKIIYMNTPELRSGRTVDASRILGVGTATIWAWDEELGNRRGNRKRKTDPMFCRPIRGMTEAQKKQCRLMERWARPPGIDSLLDEIRDART